jgi:hypothetical protein
MLTQNLCIPHINGVSQIREAGKEEPHIVYSLGLTQITPTPVHNNVVHTVADINHYYPVYKNVVQALSEMYHFYPVHKNVVHALSEMNHFYPVHKNVVHPLSDSCQPEPVHLGCIARVLGCIAHFSSFVNRTAQLPGVSKVRETSS